MALDQRAHAVDQTIAAERIEGWEPSAEHIAALTALAADDIAFDDYLAGFRSRHPPPAIRRRRVSIRRAAPYLIPGTTLLRNNFGAVSADVLAELEFVATAGRMVQWLLRADPNVDGLDVRVLHEALFGDVYAWAGKYRTIELRRGEQGFAWQSAIAAGTAAVHEAARNVVTRQESYDPARLAYELARLYADYNQLHPFREGNGRTGMVLLHNVAALCGRRLDLSGVTREAWYAASADSMPFRRDGRPSHRPFLHVLVECVRS